MQAALAIVRETSGSMAGLDRATLIMLAEDEEYWVKSDKRRKSLIGICGTSSAL